ncbi:hypothetical protein [Pedobacter sp. ASV28]|uniref:hypothetical protein n=1 Tax=Pedobacter sp. ASV28 TaxID=2795123 RepID=UPI0018EBF84E|nr:hypothetical protein [Pedobacter sp. ASV28]
MSIKRLVPSAGKALSENTTRMGGDFLANPQDLALPVRHGHGVTFAPEMGQEHTGLYYKK